MRVRAWHVALVALLGAFLPIGVAHADAVMPPPEDCPPGQVGTTSHGGPACAREAPKNCAPGYRGEVGGSCVLADCSSDAECEAGTRCVQVDACQELRELYWNGWYWRAQQRVPRSNLLGGPPAPQPEGDPPKAWVKLRICGQDGACNSPAECRPMGLCYPPSAIGKTKAKVVSAPPVAEELPEDVSSRALIASDPRTAAEKPESREGGCRRGCSISTSANLANWLSLPLLMAAILRRRRQRAKGTIPAQGRYDQNRRNQTAHAGRLF
jgi:hypothetical protein